MTININPGFKDTAIIGGKTATYTAAPLNFKDDFRQLSYNGDEAVITNLTSPVDRPETIRFSSQEIANIYRSTKVETSRYGPTKGGRSILIQHNSISSVEDDASAQDSYHLPMGVHLVLRLPNSEFVDAALVKTQISRLLGALQETGDDGNTRLTALLRGSLLPKDV